MYANILLSTDGSDVARKGVEHGIALAKSLNAKVTVITVTEALPVDYGSGHAGGWIPSKEEFDRFDAVCKERAGKVLDEARAMAEQIGISAELLHVPNAHPATAIIEGRLMGIAASRSYFWGAKHRKSWRTEACRCW
jgi:nucleotide-binding universal stress UspA family protein